MRHVSSPVVLTMTAILASACMPSAASVTRDKHADEIRQALSQPMPDARATGSLWGASGSMFADAKAHQVGDLVTIKVSENISATRALGTSKKKKSNHKTSVSALLGFETSLSDKNPNFKPTSAFDVSDEKNFDGSGSTNNSDKLTADVTAVVTAVYPNGNMKVQGRRQVTINQLPQELVFSGIIRPNDIGPDNTISSAKVAQAVIGYGGGGELATVAHEGWFTQTLDKIWPF